MDAISSQSTWAIDKKQTMADILSANYQSENVSGKRNKIRKDYIDNDTDPSSPRISFKKTFQEAASRNNEVNAAPKITRENVSEEENARVFDQSAVDAIFLKAGDGEAGDLQNSDQSSSYDVESELSVPIEMKNEELAKFGIAGSPGNTETAILDIDRRIMNLPTSTEPGKLQSAAFFEMQVSPPNAPSPTAESAPFSNVEYSEAGSVQNPNQIRSNDGATEFSVSTAMKNEEIAKMNIAGSLGNTEVEILNADDGIMNLSTSTELEELQNTVLAKAKVSPFNNPSQGETGSSTPSSREHQLQQGNGYIQKKEDMPTSPDMGNDGNQTSLDSKPDRTEIPLEKLLSRPSLQKGNQADHQGISFNQTLDSLFGNASVEHMENGRNASVDGTTFSGKSGDLKRTDPKILMNSIVEEGTQIISKGGGRVKMTLNPPNLGSLVMDIRDRNNKVEVVFIADTPEIQQSLQANTDLLKTALNQQGLKIDGYNVLLQGSMDSNSGYFSGESALWHNSRKDYGKNQNGKDEQIPPDSMANLDQGKLPDSIDSYKISLFI